jgi:vacuolar-type H+-ATPase subunit E/Vma4
LKILQTREQHLQSLFDAARDKLNGIAKDQEKYKKLLSKLILQVGSGLPDARLIAATPCLRG